MENYFKDIDKYLDELGNTKDINRSIKIYNKCNNLLLKSQELFNTNYDAYKLNNNKLNNNEDDSRLDNSKLDNSKFDVSKLENMCLNTNVIKLEKIIEELKDDKIEFVDFTNKYKLSQEIIDNCKLFLKKSKGEVKQLMKDNENDYLEISYKF